MNSKHIAIQRLYLKHTINGKRRLAKSLTEFLLFAVWDDEEKELFLCRIESVLPLYYSEKDGIFAFASRIKTLLLVPEITSAVDQNGLNEIFMLGPAKTIGSAVLKT